MDLDLGEKKGAKISVYEELKECYKHEKGGTKMILEPLHDGNCKEKGGGEYGDSGFGVIGGDGSQGGGSRGGIGRDGEKGGGSGSDGDDYGGGGSGS
ncbi:glycine-rich cell wall structural protein 1.0 [Lathyrus oleraceus]|uniref:glycine-rich cell wall structural protein 1.0 n=1 Tax=Pisum sativum TaxID=3888 RepID=UPI0021CE5B34|nr:glycine-rich cell wall structural protein 1.0-like [Pisum sativum]